MTSAATADAAVAPAPRSGQHARIERHHERIAESRRRILELTLERASVESALAIFEHDYAARVGTLYADLDRVQLDIKELLYRARLLEKGAARTQEHLDRRVESAFRRERERVDAEAANDEDTQAASRARPRAQSTAHRAHARDDSDLRSVYLRLAKRYHPDKSTAASADGDSVRLMGLINDAYETGDARRLRQLAATLHDGGEPADETADAMERRLFRQALDVDRAVRDVERDVQRLKGRNTYAMMRDAEEAQEGGGDLLGSLRADLARKIAAARERMSAIRSQFEVLASTRFASTRFASTRFAPRRA